MRLAIFNNGACQQLPQFISEKMIFDDFLNNRIVLTKLLDELECNWDYCKDHNYSDYHKFEKDPNQMYLKPNGEHNLVMIKDCNHWLKKVVTINFVEIDTTKIWRIKEYDGAEEIEYLNEVTILNEEYNYGTW